MKWSQFDDGLSIGKVGSEGGVILVDEQYRVTARITLERAAARHAVTCGVYGWLVHTRFFTSIGEAAREYDRMKSALAQIVEALPEDEKDQPKWDRTIEAINQFTEEYP